MTTPTVWDILAAAEAVVPDSMTDETGDPVWNTETLTGNGWAFEVEYDGGDVDVIVAYTPPGGERVEPHYERPTLDERILFCWRGRGDLERLRKADWSDFDKWRRELDEVAEKDAVITLPDLTAARAIEADVGGVMEAWRAIATEISKALTGRK